MKTLSILALVLVSALPFSGASQHERVGQFEPLLFRAIAFSPDDKQKPDLQALKAEADQAVARANAADPKDCTRDCLEAARKLVELADQYFTAGNVQEARTTMDNAGRLALKAGQASIETKKRRKDTEIGLRKLQKRISDIEETLDVDDRPTVHQVAVNISKARSDILMSMFDQPKKELGPDEKEKP